MTKTLPAVLLAIAFGASLAIPPVAARMTSGYFDRNINLSADDLAMMRSAARDQMDGKPDGTTNTWQNAKSGNSGSVTLVKTSVTNGQTCRRIQHTILPKGKSTPSRYFVDLCHQADGSWKSQQP
jgi:surface antigen